MNTLYTYVMMFLVLVMTGYMNLSADENSYNDFQDRYGYNNPSPEITPPSYFLDTPNSQIFPGQAQANALYWGEVQQMEEGG